MSKAKAQSEPENTSTSKERRDPWPIVADPPESWALNNLLLNLGRKMTEKDLTEVKFLFKGHFGEKILSKLTTPLEFFDFLRKDYLINSNNVIYLQVILHKLQNKELSKLALDYARTAGNVLHFYPATPNPVNGYRYVKMHVAGKDLTGYTREDLERLRDTLRQLLNVPHEFILVRGLEPSASLTVTFMMPHYYVDFLLEIVTEGIPELSKHGVDRITIDDKTFSINGKRPAIRIDTDPTTKLFQDLQRTKAKLEERDVEVLNLKRLLEKAERDKKEMAMKSQALLNTQDKIIGLKELTNKHLSESKEVPEPSTLMMQSAQVMYRNSLQKVHMVGCDLDMIQELLDANALVTAARLKSENKAAMVRLLTVMVSLQIQRDSLLFLRLPQQILEQQKPIQQMLIQTDIDPEFSGLLQDVSARLTEDDKKRLVKMHRLQDNTEQQIQLKKSNFLAYLFWKGCENHGPFIDLPSFIINCLKEVKRDDLVARFEAGTRNIVSQRMEAHRQQQEAGRKEFSSLEKSIQQLHAKFDGFEKMMERQKYDQFNPLSGGGLYNLYGNRHPFTKGN